MRLPAAGKNQSYYNVFTLYLIASYFLGPITQLVVSLGRYNSATGTKKKILPAAASHCRRGCD